MPFASGPSRIAWLDLGELGALLRPVGPLEQWQDHGLGLLRTILHEAGIRTEIRSVRTVRSWRALGPALDDFDQLMMNVRSYTYPMAVRAAKLFKERNPQGTVIVGGLHATVALDEMTRVEEFDRICRGAGEQIIADLVSNPASLPRVVEGRGARSMADWPFIDRTLWPRPAGLRIAHRFPWPLEPSCGWGPAPVATVITSRVCPWQCAFCNESAFLPTAERRPVDLVIEELNRLDENHGPIGSVVIHDSMFFQQPSWLEEWLQKYPRRARRRWPYWAAARADTIRRWPNLFEALVRETNWHTVSIGFESGSDRVLRILNKECTAEDNRFAVDLLNRIGDGFEQAGKPPPFFWANLMLGIPGETREDAFETMRLLRRMRRAQASISYFAPYPGSILGHQLIAEGKSLMSPDDYHRHPGNEKVRGVDYEFYRQLQNGAFDAEIARGLDAIERRPQRRWQTPLATA